MDKNEYICEKCDFKTSIKNRYDKHLKTELHKTGKRKTRKDKKLPDKCPHCEYKSKTYASMNAHIISNHMTQDEQKKNFKFYCNDCKSGYLYKSLYNIHLLSTKHKNKEEQNLKK